MFKKIRKHGLAISLTVGALIAAALGCTYFFPTATAAVLGKISGFFRSIGTTVAGWFTSAGGNVEVVVETPVETPAAA